MELKRSFDTNVTGYDKWRPRYCRPLFDAVLEYSGAAAGSKALEIGCGTGQATEPFLTAGVDVTAVELGSGMCAFVTDKFADYKGFKVINGPFEDFAGEDGSLDLVYSATAFHWVPPQIGYPRVFSLLRPGGTVALFWNKPSPDRQSAVNAQLQQLYSRFMPQAFSMQPTPDRHAETCGHLRNYGFEGVEYMVFSGTRTFSGGDYVALLDTYSDHRALPQGQKQEFYGQIEATIEGHGGIEIHDTMELFLAKKPG